MAFVKNYFYNLLHDLYIIPDFITLDFLTLDLDSKNNITNNQYI